MPDERQKQTSLTAINKAITSISRSAVKLNETIHNTALMCAQHTLDFEDTSPCARLVDALPMSHRRSLIIQWFEAFTPITIGKDNKSGKMKGHLRGKAEERKNMWNLPGAKATPFYAMPDAPNEPAVPTYQSIHENVVQFIKRMDKKAELIANADDKKKAEAEVAALRAAVA